MPQPDFVPSNPAVTTRKDFTANLTSVQLPPSSSPKYTAVIVPMQRLLDALAAHPAMEPNLSQTFNTPANYKSKIYFMWDFFGRTLHMWYMCDAAKPESMGPLYRECFERTMMGTMMLKDRSGKTEMMCKDDRGAKPEWGPEIERLAKEIDDAL